MISTLQFASRQFVAGFACVLLVLSIQATCATERVERLRVLDSEHKALSDEINNQLNSTIPAMERALADSNGPGLPAPDDSKLNAMGIAGIGVVGEGANKPQIIQDFLESFEDPKRPHNIAQALSVPFLQAGHMTRAIADINRAAGRAPDALVPPEERLHATNLARGRQKYEQEILRGRMFVDKWLIPKLAEVERERQAVLAELTPQELEDYDSGPLPQAAGETPAAVGSLVQQPAEAASEETSLPDLSIVTARLESAILPHRNNLARLRSAPPLCPPAAQIGKEADDTARRISENFDALALEAAGGTITDTFRGLNRLDQLAEVARKMAGDADAAGKASCAAARAVPADLDAAEAPLRRVAALQKIADALAGETADVGRQSARDIAAWNVENPSPTRDDLIAILAPLRSMCRNLKIRSGDMMNSLDTLDWAEDVPKPPEAAFSAVSEAVRDIAISMPGLERTNAWEIEVRYKDEAQQIDASIAAANLQHGNELVRCESAYSEAASNCEQHLSDISARMAEAGDPGVPAEMTERRDRALAQLRAVMSRVDEALAQIGAAGKAGEACLMNAGLTSSGDSGTASEAERLSNPADLACSGTAFDERIALLEGSRFDNVPDRESRVAELRRVRGALAQAVEANKASAAAYKSGDLNAARQAIAKAGAAFSQAGGISACAGLGSQIASRTAKIGELTSELARANASASACDLPAMKRFVSQHGGTSQATLKSYVARLQDEMPVCETRAAEAARDKNERLVAANDLQCKAEYGGNYRAVGLNANGTSNCVPNKQAANAQCAELNGKGTVAGKIRNDGSFDCVFTKDRLRADAVSWCRKTYGRSYIKTVRRGGQYQCIYNTPNRTVQQRQPRYDPNQAAAAAAASGALYSCTYANPDGSILGGGVTYSTIQSRTPIRGANCRRIR